MIIENTPTLNTSQSAFESVIDRSIQQIDLNLKKINVKFDTDKECWEWIGYVAPQLGHWVTITLEGGGWNLSAVTEQCGVLKIVRLDLDAALTELMLVTTASQVESES